MKIVWGDADCNGIFELSDCVMLAKAAAGMIGGELSVEGRVNCDLNANNFIDASDLRMALLYIAGVISESLLPPR